MLGSGDAAPEISGANINPAAPGATFKLSTISGKVVVAVFFDWRDSLCSVELDNLNTLWGVYKGLKVQFIAIHVYPDQSKAETELASKGITFPAIQDNAAKTIFTSYQGGSTPLGVPQLYVINKDHIIHSSHAGLENVAVIENRILDALNPRVPVDIEMVMDVSDTMNSPTSSGDPKLVVMKQAAKMIVDFSHDHGMTSDRMGLVWFTDDISRYPIGGTLLPVRVYNTLLKNQIAAKTTGICTAMGAGLQTAFDTLVASPQRRFAILLTDGMQNVDPFVRPVGGHLEIIDAPTEYHCTATHSIVPAKPGTDITTYNTRVHTIGVGITATYAALLSDIAAATGGTYLATNDPDNDLSLLYFVDLCTCMAGGSPAVVYHNTGTFQPEKCQVVDSFCINRTIRKITAILSWPKSCTGTLTFWLQAPDGTIIDLHDWIRFFDTYAMATVPLPVEQNGRQIPHVGEWHMITRGETTAATPYTAMVIGEDTGTHFEIMAPGKAYEVGDIIPLRIRMQEEKNYLTGPAEVVLQKKSMRVPLAELLARYQYHPAAAKRAVTAAVGESGPARLETKLKALAADPRYAEQLKPLVVTQSLKAGTLACEIMSNEILIPVKLTEPGFLTFRVNVRFNSEKTGPICRVSLASVFVRAGAADPKQSTVARIPVGTGKTQGAMLLVTPRNTSGQLIGPGKRSEIAFAAGKEKEKCEVEDMLDGTYRIMVEPVTGKQAKNQQRLLSFGGKVLWKG